MFADVFCSSVYCQNVELGVEVFYIIKDEVVADIEGDECCREDIAGKLEGEPSGNFVMKSIDRLCDNIIAKTDNIILVLLLFYLYLGKHEIKKSAAIMCCSLVIYLYIHIIQLYVYVFCIHMYTTYIGKYNYYISVSVYKDYNELIVFGACVFPL